MNESSLKLTSDRGRTYAEERLARLRRGRIVGLSVCIALWLLSAIPLARLSSDDGGGVGVAVSYLAAGFGIALVIRGIYALLKGRTLLSPWLFVTAAVLAILSYTVVSAGEKVEPIAVGALALIPLLPLP
jgi:hypothetical protein